MTAYDDTLPAQEAPQANVGYSIDYAAETNGAEVISGSIANSIGKTLYIRATAKEGVKSSAWAALPVPSRPSAPAVEIAVSKSADGHLPVVRSRMPGAHA